MSVRETDRELIARKLQEAHAMPDDHPAKGEIVRHWEGERRMAQVQTDKDRKALAKAVAS